MNINMLKTVLTPTRLETLTEAQLKELQWALLILGYPVGDADGLIGPKTRNAWAEFKTDVFEGNPSLIGPEPIAALEKSLLSIASNLTDLAAAEQAPASKEQAIELIIQECKKQDIGLGSQIAYVLATVQWETAQTFKPVKEAFWHDEAWRQNHFRYFPYYDRGYVQLTW
jgi:peptidoglycan hydrolase-like protein with peptidoglycan-binding domain